MITKTIIKDYASKKCPYLTSLELDDKNFINLLKESIKAKEKYRELLELESDGFDDDDKAGFDLLEILKDYPEFKKEIYEYEKTIEKNAVEHLIDEYNDNQLVSRLSRTYYENKYGKDKCFRCDIDSYGNEILNQDLILLNTKECLDDPNIKVIFEGQLEFDNLRARFDVLIKTGDEIVDIIEVKGTNSVFAHPSNDGKTNYDFDSKINDKYLYDLLFQYYVYSQYGLKIKSVGYLFTNRKYILGKSAYPVVDEELEDLFIEKKEINLESGTIPIKQYFDEKIYMYKPNAKTPTIINQSIEEIIAEVNDIATKTGIKPEKRYLCKKGPICPFMDLCFKDANEPNSIFKLTNWNHYGGNSNTTKALMNAGIEKISDIPEGDISEFSKKGKRKNVYTQVQYQKGNIDKKYVIVRKKIKEILEKDYIAEDIKYLIFFDFESFQYPIPLVEHSSPWKQVVSQYSMHVVSKDYDLTKHDFEKGNGGNIYHFEYIGNPDIDKFDNPSLKLYERLKMQLESIGVDIMSKDYRVIVFNKNFEDTRIKDYIDDFETIVDNSLIEFAKVFKSNIVDLLDFFTSGSIYCREFHGKGSLKIVQPTLVEDKDVLEFYDGKLLFDLSDSLNYHKENSLVYNGSICLDLYKSLLIRSHLNRQDEGIPTSLLLKQALAYCKIDSWGTVIIYDIIKNIHEGNLKLDALEKNLCKDYNTTLISGSTGSGKTTMLKKYIDEVMESNDSLIYVVDPMQLELVDYNNKESIIYVNNYDDFNSKVYNHILGNKNDKKYLFLDEYAEVRTNNDWHLKIKHLLENKEDLNLVVVLTSQIKKSFCKDMKSNSDLIIELD